MTLYTLFLSKRWWWDRALLTWSLMGPCVFFFLSFCGGSFKIWRCFLVCAIEKNGATWRTRHLKKKQQKPLLANQQAMWLVKWFDSSFLFFKPTFIRDKHTRKSIRGLILSKLPNDSSFRPIGRWQLVGGWTNHLKHIQSTFDHSPVKMLETSTWRTFKNPSDIPWNPIWFYERILIPFLWQKSLYNLPCSKKQGSTTSTCVSWWPKQKPVTWWFHWFHVGSSKVQQNSSCATWRGSTVVPEFLNKWPIASCFLSDVFHKFLQLDLFSMLIPGFFCESSWRSSLLKVWNDTPPPPPQTSAVTWDHVNLKFNFCNQKTWWWHGLPC